MNRSSRSLFAVALGLAFSFSPMLEGVAPVPEALADEGARRQVITYYQDREEGVCKRNPSPFPADGFRKYHMTADGYLPDGQPVKLFLEHELCLKALRDLSSGKGTAESRQPQRLEARR